MGSTIDNLKIIPLDRITGIDSEEYLGKHF